MENSLKGKRIVLPENRQLDLLADLLEKENATVMRCPMFSILDTPDRKPANDWIKNFIDKPFDIFIILTGEGLFRLTRYAEDLNFRTEFAEAINKSKTLIRGPKPRKALSALNLKPDIIAEQPTTDGVITTLEDMEIGRLRIGVQLYGEEPNLKLIDFINSKNAHAIAVSPYIYAPKSDDHKVLEIIESIKAAEVDMIAFTSKEQVSRLKKVLTDSSEKMDLKDILKSTKVAAVGPVVLERLNEEGVQVAVSPKDSYFLKPMVIAIKKFFTE